MKIFHLYDPDNNLIAQHVTMLQARSSVYETVADSGSADILHIHGCWRYSLVRQAMQAHRKGVRIVFTPHGGLEPWVIAERRLSEKLAKTLLWQRRLVESCYVIISQGKMEAEALRQLGWNPRIEIVRNAVVTNSITEEAMVQQTRRIYQKVMDSNTLDLLSPTALQLMTMLLKAGITGDQRWVGPQIPPDIDETEWRRLLIYADHENVRTLIDKGSHVLKVQQPYIETGKIQSYMPTSYVIPKMEAHEVAEMVAEIHRGNVTLRHLVELDRALRRDNVQDDWLCDALEEARQLKYFRRLLQVLAETTGLDEGFMPAKPINDRQTQNIRNTLRKHLRI